VCGADYLLDKTEDWRENIRDASTDSGEAGEAHEGSGFNLRSVLGSLGGDAAERLFHEPLRDTFGGELQSILLLGELVPPDVEEALDSADTDVLDVYGHPECGVCHVEQPGSQAPAAVGRPVEGYEARIAGPDNQGIGNIEIASDVLFEDYWDGSGPRSVVDGWLQTGDRGRIEEGLLYLE